MKHNKHNSTPKAKAAEIGVGSVVTFENDYTVEEGTIIAEGNGGVGTWDVQVGEDVYELATDDLTLLDD